jgi:hypothetical protein
VEDRVQLVANSSFLLDVESEARAELDDVILMEDDDMVYILCAVG